MRPQISVLLAVYNGSKYLQTALDSLYNQTIKNIEIIAIDDGSSDDSYQILKKQNDNRLKIYTQKNIGLAATLNKALSQASAPYIARMDQDDWSERERLKVQLQYLKKHEKCAIVGTWSRIWRNNELTKKILKHPLSNPAIQFALLFDNPFVHSSVMAKKSVIEGVGGYSTDFNRHPPEDFELWSRIPKKYELANIPLILHNYREVENSMSRVSSNPFAVKSKLISFENITNLLEKQNTKSTIEKLVSQIHFNKNYKISFKDRKLFTLLLNDLEQKIILKYHPTLLEKLEITTIREEILNKLDQNSIITNKLSKYIIRKFLIMNYVLTQ